MVTLLCYWKLIILLLFFLRGWLHLWCFEAGRLVYRNSKQLITALGTNISYLNPTSAKNLSDSYSFISDINTRQSNAFVPTIIISRDKSQPLQ